MPRHLSVFIAAILLGACSWGIKLDMRGEKVRVAWDGNVVGCKDIGKVSVSVLDHVGPIDRSSLKVRDELEVMARNEAAGMNADTIKPLGDPRDGGQSWGAYVCGTNAPPSTVHQRGQEPQAPAQTYPLKHD